MAELKDVDITWATVIDVSDPKKLGRIKVVAPSKMDNRTLAVEDMPWVYPFLGYSGSIDNPSQIGTKVWLLHNRDNYNAFYYLPAPNITDNQRRDMAEMSAADGEVLMYRDRGSTQSKITYDTERGVNVNTAMAQLNVGEEAKASLSADGSGIKTDAGQVTVGKLTAETEPAVLGDSLKKLLNDLALALQECASAALSGVYTPSISEKLMRAAQAITNNIDSIISPNVNISKKQ